MPLVGWPFVGRKREVATLRGLMLGGEAAGAVVAGTAGVGKTRLAVEGLRLAEEAGRAVVQATGTWSATGLPLGAFEPLLPRHDRPGTVDDRADMLQAAVAALVERAQGRPLVVFVDDAHSLDDTSATLVHQLVTTRAAFVLAALRPREPAPDAVVALWKDGLVQRLDLPALADDGVRELLEAALGGPVAAPAVSELARRSQGNLLFLREMVTGAVAGGALVRDGGEWVLRGPLTPSARLVELIEARLAGLDPAHRSLLELVAYGEPLRDAELDVVADLRQVEGLERQGLLASRLTGSRVEVRLAHPLYGEVVRAATTPDRERSIARVLAEAVEARGPLDQDDVLRVAAWRLAGGGAHPRVLLDGATAARWRYDFPLAERLARAALDSLPAAVPPGAEAERIRFEAALLAGQLAGLQGRNEQAERELAALAAGAAGDDQRGAVALARIQNSVIFSDQTDLAILDEAERTIGDLAWRDRIAAERLFPLALAAGPRACLAAAEPLLARAGGETLTTACIPTAYVLGRAGRLGEALAVGERGSAAHRTLTSPSRWYAWWHTFVRCVNLGHAGRFAEAEALATGMLRQARADRSREAEAEFAVAVSWTVADRGRVETATRLCREVVAGAREIGRPLNVGLGLAFQALALALAGKGGEAAEVLAAYDALGIPTIAAYDAELVQARAWTAAATGDPSGARRHLERSAGACGAIDDLVGQAGALHALARLGHAADVRHDLAAVAVHIDGDLAPARVAHAHALAAGDPDALDDASRRFEAMGADLLAAEAAAGAADAHRDAGSAREAAAHERRAAALARRCEGARTPALRAVVARPPLSPVEREAAELAAGGHTNRQIAERLALSTRTVENRLRRAYAKLGVDRRAELAQALDATSDATSVE